MDHGHHGNEPMAPMCKMHMLWNWETIDACIVFESWHVRSMAQFVVSCLVIVFIGVAFEWLRRVQRKYDEALAGGGMSAAGVKRLGATPRLLRAALYSALTFISFFVMLIFMTYNGFLIVAVVAGAFIGHYVWNGELVTDDAGATVGSTGIACH